MTHHPHVHMIVLGGGLPNNGKRWLACRPTVISKEGEVVGHAFTFSCVCGI